MDKKWLRLGMRRELSLKVNKFDTNNDASNKKERIFQNFLEFNGIYLNSIKFYEFPDVLLSSGFHFCDI